MKKTIIALIVIAFVIQSLSFTGTGIRLSKLWESDSIFMTPESVVFDSLRNCLYVSNFNDKGGLRRKTDTIFDECISKVDLEGNIVEFRWIDNLIGPTGLTIFKDTLYVVERGYLTKIDIEKQVVIYRLKIEDSGFLNDIAIDRAGSTNLFSVSIPDKKIKVVASNVSMGIDGIKKLRENYIVSFQYNMFIVNEQGVSQIILNTKEENYWNADFELIESENIVIVPGLLSNKIIAYKINYE